MAPGPSFCAERSAVAEPTPGVHLGGGGSCDCAQDDRGRGSAQGGDKQAAALLRQSAKPSFCAERSVDAEPTPGMHLGRGGSCDCAQDDRGRGSAQGGAKQATALLRQSAKPSFCAERSVDAEPTPGMHLVRGGSCDCAQDDRGRGSAQGGAKQAAALLRQSAKPSFCAERSAVAEPTPGIHLGGGGSCDCAQDDRGRGSAQGGDTQAAALLRQSAKLSFCAERSAVAESTPAKAHPGARGLRLRAG